MGNLDLAFGRTEQRNYIEMGLSTPGGALSTFHQHRDNDGNFHWAFSALYTSSSGWIEPAETSSSQIDLVVVHMTK